MANSRIENLTSISASNVADGDMLVIDDVDADQAKSLTVTEARELLNPVVVRSGQADSYVLNQDDNALGTGCTTATLTGAGNISFPNKIGADDGLPAGTDRDPGWSADTAYTSASNPAVVATISGGYDNVNNQIAGTIGGGGHNMISYHVNGHSTIVGGAYNWIAGAQAYIGGGSGNNIRAGHFSGIGFGEDCRIDSGDHQTIVGGDTNQILDGDQQTIVGGVNNTISGNVVGGLIAGGSTNQISGSSSSSVIAGGTNNRVIGAPYVFIAGGNNNRAQGSYSAVFGENNRVSPVGHTSLVFGSGAFTQSPASLTFTGRSVTSRGDAQAMSWHDSIRTTTTGTAYLHSYGGTHGYMLDNAVMTGVVHIQGIDEATGNIWAGYAHFTAKRYNDSASLVTGTVTELIDQITVTDPSINVASWGAVRAKVEGKSMTNIVWTARFDVTQALIPMSESVSVDTGADTLTITTHEFQVGEKVQLSGSVAPTGLAFATDYYVVSATGGTSSNVGGKVLKLSTTLGGDAIDITSTGTSVTIARA